MRETNSDRLTELVQQTEEAMFLRSQELGREPQRSDEEEELRQAARQLLELKVKKLGWPDPPEDRY